MKWWRIGLISAAVVLGVGTRTATEGSLPSGGDDLAGLRARANLHTIARFALVFQGVEGRDAVSLGELLSVPYSPFPDGYFVNPYTGGPLEEHNAGAIWSALEAAGLVRLYGGQRHFVEGTLPNEGSSPLPYGTVTAMTEGGRTRWALVTDPDGTRSRAKVLFWAHPPEDTGTPQRPEAPLSPEDYRAKLHLSRVARTWVITYRKWFSWVKDPAERKLIFLCSEMHQTVRRYMRANSESEFQPARWNEILQYAYDHGWIKLVNPINPYTGRQMKLVPYSEWSEGDFWFFGRLPAKADLVSTDPRPVRQPVPFCFGKQPKVLYPYPELLWDMLSRLGELEYPMPPRWWRESAE